MPLREEKLMEWAAVAAGLYVLLIGGDFLVKGAVALALRLGVPAFLVSLTIVAFGTSAPELLVSIQAVFDGVPGISLGNIVGSNIANVLLVLGVPAVLSTLAMRQLELRKSYLIMVIATLVFMALAFNGVFLWWSGAILLSVLGFSLGESIKNAKSGSKEEAFAGDEDIDPEAALQMSWLKIALLIFGGLVALPAGAHFLIKGATEIAIGFGVSDTIIGLTLVALGTSLPELATTVAAARKGQADVALGNVIGSNMFNVLAIAGITSLLAPIPVDPILLEQDIWIMLGATLLLAPFVFLKWNLGRLGGLAFVLAYGLYISIVVM